LAVEQISRAPQEFGQKGLAQGAQNELSKKNFVFLSTRAILSFNVAFFLAFGPFCPKELFENGYSDSNPC
jgi:hypothetical protein